MRAIALPPITGGEANASDTTDTANSRPPHDLPKLLDGDGADADQSRQAGIRDILFLLHKVPFHGNQGFQNPVAASVGGLTFSTLRRQSLLRCGWSIFVDQFEAAFEQLNFDLGAGLAFTQPT
jgi:hypothetical protein